MKTKRKPWYRPRNIALGFLTLFICFLAWAGYWVYWALTVEPNPSIDYAAQLEQLARDAQPPGENGWPDIERALEIFSRLDEVYPIDDRISHNQYGFGYGAIYASDYESLYADELLRDGLTIEDVRKEVLRALEWLKDNGAWSALANASEKPNFVRPTNANGGMLLEVELPEISTMRELARARLATLHRAVADKDAEEVEQAARDIMTLERAMFAQAFMINAMVANSIRSMLYRYLEESLATHHLERNLAEGLLDVLDAFPPPHDVAMHFEGERRFLLDIVQWFYSDDGDGDGVLLFAKFGPLMARTDDIDGLTAISWGQPDWPAITNLGGIAFASRHNVTTKVNSIFDRIVLHVTSSEPGQAPNIEMVCDEVAVLDQQYALLALFMSRLHTAVNTHDAVRMHHDAARIMLAIEIYRAEHGAPPDTLNALIPDELSSVPTDAINGKSFGYRTLDDDALGRDYLLYTFGTDGEDNGGIQVSDGSATDAVVFLHGITGVDYVINQPPRPTSGN